MNARSVSAGRRLGLMLIIASPWSAAKAANIIVTVTGRIQIGTDNVGIFKLGELRGQPFRLVYTFDDTKGRPLDSTACGNISGIAGGEATSPATALLTINGVSVEFGKRSYAHSSTLRSIASECSPSNLLFQVSDGYDEARQVVIVAVHPPPGRTLTQDPDWRGPLFIRDMVTWGEFNGFNIMRDPRHGAHGAFAYESISIERK
jgi:hypothetical protein